MKFIIFLKNLLKKDVKVRMTPESDICPFCKLSHPLIYDQKHDCCTTCKTKWEI